jgi:hypothetical protein
LINCLERNNPGFDGLDDVVVAEASASTPEPASILLFGAMLLGAGGLLRRRLAR